MKITINKPVIINKLIKAFFEGSNFSSITPLGTALESPKIAAAAMNKIPTTAYRMITFIKSNCSIISSVTAAEEPNSANATMRGPIIVPKELTPPPKFTLVEPVAGSPNEIAKGLAAVCCKEKPKATINKPISMPENVFPYTANIIAVAPKAENNNPKTILFLYPHFPTKSFPEIEPRINKNKAPK